MKTYLGVAYHILMRQPLYYKVSRILNKIYYLKYFKSIFIFVVNSEYM